MPHATAARRAAPLPVITGFQRALLRWYRRHQRPLPWRTTRDPYKILVSEIMLQQTQVDRVIPKYHQFLERYPDLAALSKARLPELKKVWYPLGYNIRPIRLRKIAKTVMTQHGGQLPGSYDGLLALEGIGRYTAGAVLSFAFGQDAPILDTNVERLLSRYFGGPATVMSKKALWAQAEAVIPRGNAYDINQAMMDFGAMICVARKPKCAGCALRRGCASFPYGAAIPSATPTTHEATPAPADPRRHRGD